MFAVSFVQTNRHHEILALSVLVYRDQQIEDQLICLIKPTAEVTEQEARLVGVEKHQFNRSPQFHEVAKRFVQLLEHITLVCFDIQSAKAIVQSYLQLGYHLQIPQLILQELNPGYNLDFYETCKRMGIPVLVSSSLECKGHALGKLFKFFRETNSVKQSVLESLPYGNLFKIEQDLPHEVGVFYIYDKDDQIVYLNVSEDIKNSVDYLFAGRSLLSRQIQAQAYRVSYELTGHLLVALVKAHHEWKLSKPALNIQPIDSTEEPIPAKAMLLIFSGRTYGERSFIYCDNAKVQGYGYCDLAYQIRDREAIDHIMVKVVHDSSITGEIKEAIKQKTHLKIIYL